MSNKRKRLARTLSERRPRRIARIVAAVVGGGVVVAGLVAVITIATGPKFANPVSSQPVSIATAEQKAISALTAHHDNNGQTWSLKSERTGPYDSFVNVAGSQRTIQVYELTMTGVGTVPACPPGAKPGTRCPAVTEKATAEVIVAQSNGAVLWRSVSSTPGA